MVPGRLHAPLRIPNRLEHGPGLLEVLREAVFLLADLAEQHAQLVGDVGDGVVVRLLAPVGELGGDGGALAAGGFVGADCVGFAFDELVELLAEVGLHVPA